MNNHQLILSVGLVVLTMVLALASAPDQNPTRKDGSIMADTATPNDVEQAKELAMQATQGKLSQDHEYTTTVKDKGDVWEVVILPKGRVRGGGAKVTVSKEDRKILKVVYLQ